MDLKELIFTNASIRDILTRNPQLVQRFDFNIPSYFTRASYSSVTNTVSSAVRGLKAVQLDTSKKLLDVLNHLNGVEPHSILGRLTTLESKTPDDESLAEISSLMGELQNVSQTLSTFADSLTTSLRALPSLPRSIGADIIDRAVPATSVISLNRASVGLVLPTIYGDVLIRPILAQYDRDLYLYLDIPEYQKITAPVRIALIFIHPEDSRKVLQYSVVYDPSLPQFQGAIVSIKLDIDILQKYLSWPHTATEETPETDVFTGRALVALDHTIDTLLAAIDALPKFAPSSMTTPLPLPLPLSQRTNAAANMAAPGYATPAPHSTASTTHTSPVQPLAMYLSSAAPVSAAAAGAVPIPAARADPEVSVDAAQVYAAMGKMASENNKFSGEDLKTQTALDPDRPFANGSSSAEARKTKKSADSPVQNGQSRNHNYFAYGGADDEEEEDDESRYVLDSNILFELRELIDEYKKGEFTESQLCSFIDSLDPNTRDKYHHTALITGAYSQCPLAVQRLVENGAYVNARDLHGVNALMKSVLNSDLESVEAMLQAPDIKVNSFQGKKGSKQSKTVLFASLCGPTISVPVVMALLRAGARLDDVHIQNHGQTSAFFIVAKAGKFKHFEPFEYMIEHHNNPKSRFKQDIPFDIIDSKGDNIILHAARYPLPAKYWQLLLGKATHAQRQYYNIVEKATVFTHLIKQYIDLVEKKTPQSEQKKNNIFEVARVLFNFSVFPSENDIATAVGSKHCRDFGELLVREGQAKKKSGFRSI